MKELQKLSVCFGGKSAIFSNNAKILQNKTIS
jgi:hypothetical protein